MVIEMFNPGNEVFIKPMDEYGTVVLRLHLEGENAERWDRWGPYEDGVIYVVISYSDFTLALGSSDLEFKRGSIVGQRHWSRQQHDVMTSVRLDRLEGQYFLMLQDGEGRRCLLPNMTAPHYSPFTQNPLAILTEDWVLYWDHDEGSIGRAQHYQNWKADHPEG